MDKYRNKFGKENNSKNDVRVVKMVPITPRLDQKVLPVRTGVEEIKSKVKKRSALEISNFIGLSGAFGRTLSDLHKQGK